ncbi:glycosyltransferase [Flavobacterium longum]|uniref:glycosyltransferase n=1 Tax=Flavobacterium longum TaxID=1299340 RepID=UPI0039E8000F
MILMYHKVFPSSPTMWWVFVNDFYRQMAEIAHKEVVYLDDYDPANPNQVVITFDGIYKNVLEYALPIMRKFDYPFELFVTSDYIGLPNEFDSVEPNSAFASAEELKELVQNKGRLQWHTRSHPNMKDITDRERIAHELSIPEDVKALDPDGFKWFAYPHGEFNDVLVAEVRKNFVGAVSCIQGNDTDPYILNRLTVVSKTSLRGAKISCIVASYNYGAFLIEAVESVLRQTILPDEILISDDCSDDDTQLIAETYVRKYPHLVRYNRNPKNLGIVDHFNKAISLTTGDYIFFLGADNRLVSNYLEASADVLDSDANIGVAYTDYALFGPRAKKLYETFPASRQGGVIGETYYQISFPVFGNRNDLQAELQAGNFIQGSSMFRRKAYEAVGGYKASGTAEDYHLFQRMVNQGWDAKKVTNTNLEYRQHSPGQANNVLALTRRVMFYSRALSELQQSKNSFEQSAIYRKAFALYKSYSYVKSNRKKPKKIASKIWRKVKSVFK